LAKQEKINHVVLNRSLGERVKDKVFHIQTVNAYHMRLKQWLAPFHGVATKNLHKYLGWFGWFELNKHGNLSPASFMKDMHCISTTSANIANNQITSTTSQEKSISFFKSILPI
jgi:hypothetical protein